MKFKVINKLENTKEGKTLTIESTYDSFEEVADKVAKDLSSLWKGMIPFPFNVTIEMVDENTPTGAVMLEGGEEMANTKGNKDAEEWSKQVLDLYGAKMRERFGDKRFFK